MGGPPKDEWIPVTKLGRLVKFGHVKSLEQIYTHSIPIKEAPIVEQLVKEAGKALSDEVMKIISVQKQTKAGQRTRFKAIVSCGDQDGHVGIGIKVAKEVQIAIKGALVSAKLNLIPVRRGYYMNKIGAVHTLPGKITGKAGSVRSKLTPAPRGTGIVGAPIAKKILTFAGIDDVYSQTTGHTRTAENFIKAVFAALTKTYQYLSPDLWGKTETHRSPLSEHADWLAEQAKKPARTARPKDGERRGRGGRGRGEGRGRGRGGPRGPRRD